MKDLKAIIKKCIRGNDKAYEKLYHYLAGELLGVCIRYTRSEFEAEDYLQDAFVLIFKNLKKYKGSGAFEGWAKKITINVILSDFRKKNALRESKEIADADLVTLNLEGPLSHIREKELLNFIQLLPEGKRVVFNLYVIEGYSHEEVGELLGISKGTSKSQLSKAKEMLKEIHKKYNEIHDEEVY